MSVAQLAATPATEVDVQTGDGSKDPNALIGPAGYGTQGFIQPTGNLPYTVDFENDGSVAAQDVTVTEQLDPNLDWSTFQLGSFGFGPVNVTVPAGLTQYQTTVAYQNTDGSALNVLVALDFNVQTGLLTVTFISLDPLTGQAPTGVFDGFLPPDNDSSGVGEGYVQYTIQPKAGLATGTTINAQAASSSTSMPRSPLQRSPTRSTPRRPRPWSIRCRQTRLRSSRSRGLAPRIPPGRASRATTSTPPSTVAPSRPLTWARPRRH